MRFNPPVVLPSIPAGGLQAAKAHASIRGQDVFRIVPVNNSWTVALEKWSGNHPKTPWRAHLFDQNGKWRGVTGNPRATPEQAYNDSLAAISQKNR